MKWNNLNVELVGEYAKDATWEKRHQVFDDQLYMLAKQNRKLERLKGQVDFVVTDSPLLLNKAYIKTDYFPSTYPAFVDDLFNSYDNFNVFIMREKPYHAVGRRQSENEARKIDEMVLNMLMKDTKSFYTIPGNQTAAEEIFSLLV